MFLTCGKFFLARKFNAKFRQKVKVRFRDENIYKKKFQQFLSYHTYFAGERESERRISFQQKPVYQVVLCQKSPYYRSKHQKGGKTTLLKRVYLWGNYLTYL